MRAAGFSIKSAHQETTASALSFPDCMLTSPRQRMCKTSVHLDIVHGTSTVKSESVNRTFLAMRYEGTRKILNDHAEKIYRSYAAEPLGKCVSHGYILPPATHTFGVKSISSDSSGIKTVMSPASQNDDKVRRLYKRTHHDYDAGEQITRGYVLPNAIQDDANFRYGLRRKSHSDCVRDCFNPN